MSGLIEEGVVKVTVDGSDVKGEFADIANSGDKLGAALEKAGARGAKGVRKLADGAEGVSNRIDRATNSIKNSIERNIAVLNAGGRGTAAFQESLAKLRGADLTVLKPYIEQLKQAEKAADLAALSNNKLGITSKQTAFALRNVPAQFSDIVVSLQAGQAPLTVFLQQGAQLKDLFGGAGTAARALGSYILGLVNPFTLAAGAATALGVAYYAGSEQSERLTRALITSGNVVGQSEKSLEGLAQKAGALSGSYGKARQAVEALTSSGQISSNILESSISGVVAGAQLTGRTIKELVQDFESIGKNPVKAVTELNQKYNFLTLEIFKQIESLEKQGRAQDASTLAAKTYADTLSNRQTEMLKNIGAIERGWLGVKEATSSALNSILSIGRASTPSDVAAKAIAESRDRLSKLRSAGVGGGTFGTDAEIEKERQTLLLLVKANAERQAREILEGKRAQREKDQISSRDVFNKLISDPNNQSKKQAEESKIAEINAKFNAQLALYEKSTEEYKKLVQARDQAISNVREKSSAADNKSAQSAMEKLANAYANAKDRAEDFIRTQKAQLSQDKPLSAAQKLSADLLDLIADKKIKLSGIEQKTIEGYAQQILKLDELNIAHEKEIKFYEDYEKLADERDKAAKNNIERIIEQTFSLEQQNRLFGLSESAIIADTIAIKNRAIAMLDGQDELTKILKEEVYWLERKLSAQTNKEFLEKEKEINEERKREAKRTADEILRTNQKMAEDINKSLTDALLRGFEDGKSFAKNFRDTLINMFKTLVLRPVIDLVLNSSGITKVLGTIGSIFSGNALAGGGILSSGNGSASILGQLSSIGDIFKLGNQSVVSSIESLGAFIANGNGGLLDTIGGFIGANSGAISSAIPYAGALFQALSGNLKGGALTAIGTAIGGPIGGAIGGLIGGFFGGKSPPKFSSGVNTFYANGVSQSSPFAAGYKNLGADENLSTLNEAFSKTLGNYLSRFGLSDAVTSKSALIQAGKSADGIFNASFAGGSVSLNINQKGRVVEEVAKKLVEAVLGETLADAVSKSAIPSGIKSLFEGLTDKAQIEALMNATASLSDAQSELAKKYNLTLDGAGKVIKATGLAGEGLSVFATKLAQAGSESRTAGEVLTKARDTLSSQLSSFFGDVVTESVTKNITKLVEVQNTSSIPILSFNISQIEIK